MIKSGRILLVNLVCMLGFVATADAQTASAPPRLTPPSIMPAMPTYPNGPMVMPPMALQGQVPELPPSRSCGPQDVLGLWKLLQVYEEPSGPELSVFYSMPSQYVRFTTDGMLGLYEKELDVSLLPQKVLDEMKQQNRGLQQFVVQAGGQMYFYRDSVAVKQQACFIVVNGSNFFASGQMLLMPPNPQSPTRWVKVYSKIWMQEQPQQESAPQNNTQPKEVNLLEERAPKKKKH